MNEHQNTALIQKVHAAFDRGDVQTILEALAPNVEWILDGPETIPYSGKKIGPDQVLKFLEAMVTTQDAPKLTISDYIAQGDKVVTIGRYSAVIKATGKRVDCAAAHIFTVRDGKIIKFVDFVDTAHIADAYIPTAASSRVA